MANASGDNKKLMTKVLPAAAQPKTLRSVLSGEAMRAQVALALPRHLKDNAEKYTRQMLTLMNLNPDIGKCDQGSVLGALMTASALGLELAPSLQQCYVIPRYSKKSGTMQAHFQLGYRGMIALARRSGEIKDLRAMDVCDGDEFSVDFGPGGGIVHRPLIRGRRGAAYCYYAFALLTNGGLVFDVMSREDMEAHAQAYSESYAGKYRSLSPWASDFDEMAKKTMLRRIWKLLPLSTEVLKAEAQDDGVKVAPDDIHVESEMLDLPASAPAALLPEDDYPTEAEILPPETEGHMEATAEAEDEAPRSDENGAV
ncbi:recombinase RecT [Pyramidobacter sp.]|uniref:recombinase RecT n=1 Tax=Pyramidobacter sp. TaxID=1943581 RepID=UPI00332721D9